MSCDILSLSEQNESLRAELRELLEAIDVRSSQVASRSRQPQRSSVVGRSPFTVPNVKQELDAVIAGISKLRNEIEQSHQAAAIRSVQDRIKSTKQKLRTVQDELAAVSTATAKQQRLLQEAQPSVAVANLQAEVQKEKKLNAELRRTAVDVEQRLRVKQRICAQLEDSIETFMESRPRSALLRSDGHTLAQEVRNFEEELSQSRIEIQSLQCELDTVFSTELSMYVSGLG